MELDYTDSGYAAWPPTKRRPSVQSIRSVVCELMGVYEPDWTKTSPVEKPRGMSDARGLVAMVCRVTLGYSYPEAARAAGFKTHSAIAGPNTLCQRLLRSEAGRILYNAVVERLFRDLVLKELSSGGAR